MHRTHPTTEAANLAAPPPLPHTHVRISARTTADQRAAKPRERNNARASGRTEEPERAHAPPAAPRATGPLRATAARRPRAPRPARGLLTLSVGAPSAGRCGPWRAGRFLYMPKVRPRRGAASGGERRSHGAARSNAAPQAARGRAQAPPSGRSRARCFARGASPPADRRSCALRCTRTCAGEAAARRGWPPLWWVLSCAMYGAARHPCVENMREVWSRGVVVSLRDFYFACYNI